MGDYDELSLSDEVSSILPFSSRDAFGCCFVVVLLREMVRSFFGVTLSPVWRCSVIFLRSASLCFEGVLPIYGVSLRRKSRSVLWCGFDRDGLDVVSFLGHSAMVCLCVVCQDKEKISEISMAKLLVARGCEMMKAMRLEQGGFVGICNQDGVRPKMLHVE